jgi:hypothetical protein
VLLRNFQLLLLLLSLTSCDAVLNLAYVVQNKTKDTLSVYAPASNELYSFNRKDSIFLLAPNQSLCVGRNRGIGFPWETKKLFRKNPALWNFSIEYQGEKVPFIKNDKDWKYMCGVSLYTIKKVK